LTVRSAAPLAEIGRSYLPIVQRTWRALAAHVADDSSVIEVLAAMEMIAGQTRP
jgi:hypothetical protein